MVKLILKNFRCYSDLTIDFDDNKITLLKGNSGRGKTTILNAIYWCLYGSLQSTYNNIIGQKRSYVEFHINNLIIYRQKQPNLLKLSEENIELKDNDAQSRINQIFGDKNIWLCSCFIQQGQKSTLLSSSASEKIDILNSIAFNEDIPGEIIKKIENEKVNCVKEFEIRDKIYYQELKSFNQESKNYKLSFKLDEQQKNENRSSYDKLVIEKEYLDNLLDDYLNNKALFNTLTSEKEEISSYDNRYKCIDHLINEKEKIEKEIIRNSIIEKYIDVYNYPDCEIKFSHDQYLQTLEDEKIINKCLELCSECNIEYNKDVIDTEINRIYNIISTNDEKIKSKEKRNLINQLNNIIVKDQYSKEDIDKIDTTIKQSEINRDLIDKINNIIVNDIYTKEDIDTITEQIKILKFNKDIMDKVNKINVEHEYSREDIDTITEQINKLEMCKDIINCPDCKSSLRYNNGKLIKAEGNAPKSGEIEELISNKEYILRQFKLNEEKQKLLSKLQPCNEDDKLTDEYINQLISDKDYVVNQFKLNEEKQKLLDKLRTYNGVENPLTKEQISQLILNKEYMMQQFKLNEEKNNLLKKLSLYETVRDNLDEPLSNKEIDKFRKINDKLRKITVINNPKYSSEFIEKCLKKQDLMEKFPEYSDINWNDSVPNDKLKEEKDKIIKLISESEKHNLNVENNLRRLDIIVKKLKEIDLSRNIKDELDLVIKKISELQEKYNKAIELDKMLERQNKLKLEGKEIKQLKMRIDDLIELKNIAIVTEKDTLCNLINTINLVIEDVLNNVFDEPISVKLSLFKTLKSTGQHKPIINLNISYKGSNYDNVNQLSGGESTRVSLAITLALAKINNSPIIMLDEPLSSLDGENRVRSLEAIKSVLGKRTVLVVNHEIIEGDFDNVFSLS